MRHGFAVLMILGALAGLVFASLSTADFVQHLDRQVHAIHCSFVPGLAPSTDATSGCHVALMSPWSSVFRSWIWGGLPISLPGMAVFAFLLFRGVELWAVRGLRDRRASGFLLAAVGVPVLTSVFYGSVALLELDAFCKTCAGIYASSLVCLVAAVGLVFTTGAPTPAYDPDSAPEGDDPPAPTRTTEPLPVLWAVGVAEGVGFVVLMALLYVAVMPDHGRYVGTCGELAEKGDPGDILVPLGENRSGRDAIEVFDPLCPACKGFERRLGASGLAAELDRKAVLFPLDDTCNWMVSSAIHPGACTVSEAILCAGDDAGQVIDWAFAEQEAIRTAATADPEAARAMVSKAFPALAKCVGGTKVRQRLNRSLRWAVANELPVLTPQLYVDGRKLCDEDTDLGMDFALTRLLALGGR